MTSRDLIVISEEAPPMSGETDAKGSAHIVNKSIVMFAQQMREVGAEANLDVHLEDLKSLCPHATNDAGDIERFMQKRADDLANNVTHIFGRPELHTTTDLVAHSCLRFRSQGHLRRGWLDANMTGPTRSGKSNCVQHQLQHYRVGKMVACMENVSRSGLTMGAMSTRSGSKVQPGMFPRMHKKMLVLDEFHHMAQTPGGDHIMTHLQSARDRGVVTGVKVYGATSMPAAVRLITICNWAKRSVNAYRFPCQHVAHFYGPPESLARLDFAIAVSEIASETDLHDVPHNWHEEVCHALITRAWAMEPDMITIDPKAEELARAQCKRMAEVYADELPLFTREEKFLSILRIAIAVANETFSHPKDSIYHCWVRPVHVEWAVAWLEFCFQTVGYDVLSASLIRAREIEDPFEVELLLTVDLGLGHAGQAALALNSLMSFSAKSLIGAYTSKDMHKVDQWIGSMIKHGAFQSQEGNYHQSFGPTRGGAQIMQNIVRMAEENPNAYEQRYTQLAQWKNQRTSGPAVVTPPGSLFPMNCPPEDLPDEYYADADPATNIINIEPIG